MDKKYKTVRIFIFIGVFIISFFLFFCKNDFIKFQDSPIIVAEQTDKTKDIYNENYEKTNNNIEKIKESIKEGDSFNQEGDIIIVKRKNGQTEKYEIVHGIAGDSLIKTF